jgi:hypothetical protein
MQGWSIFRCVIRKRHESGDNKCLYPGSMSHLTTAFPGELRNRLWNLTRRFVFSSNKSPRHSVSVLILLL